MRIKIASSVKPELPDIGPYVTRDVIERASPYQVGEMTYYGVVTALAPCVDDEADQCVIVKLDPETADTRPNESVLPKSPSSYNNVQFFPIQVDRGYWSDEPPPVGSYTIMENENLTVEDVSSLITPDTFSLWTKDCSVSKDTANALQNVRYAIVHRYVSKTDRDTGLDSHATELINLAAACMALIRPTIKSIAMNVLGVIEDDGTFQAHGFSASLESTQVPDIQQLFTIRTRDIVLLRSVLPEFIQLYQKDNQGKMKEEYEPLRMAEQLYEQAYAIQYWKARHILWWSAIEALYGGDDVAKARIYAFFGDKNLIDGYNCPIYEEGDIPSCYFPSSHDIPTLGKTVPLIYDVRNASAHGNKVPDTHFRSVPHPFGEAAEKDVLAEAATFVIRKTVIEILRRGWRNKFKGPRAREDFWLCEYGMNKKQSHRQLEEMNALLKLQKP